MVCAMTAQGSQAGNAATVRRRNTQRLTLPARAKQMGLCIVGPGGIAGVHMRALDQLGLRRRIWVVGENTAEAEQFAVTWGFGSATDDLREALADDAVDLVFVCSPNALHADQARRALDAGKHVIVEIPAAMSLDETKRLADRADSVGRRLLVCHSIRAHPAVRWLRDQVASGSLSVSQIIGLSATIRRHNEHWAGGTRSWVDNILWHHGCHAIDTSMWILGITEIAAVSAFAGRRNPEFGMTMDLSVTFSTPDRQLVTHCLTYNTPQDESILWIITDDALLTMHGGTLTSRGKTLIRGHPWSDLRDQDHAMLTAVADGHPSDFDVGTVLPTMTVLEQIQQLGGSQ
jgi:2-hydroxy-4-carboxymuconate semialdehyde hemiacetal dehydrogenase